MTPTAALARALADWRSRPAEPMPWDTEDAEKIVANLAALGYEVRPITERERYEALRRYRFATEGIEQAAEANPGSLAESPLPERSEGNGGLQFGVDGPRATSAAVAPLARRRPHDLSGVEAEIEQAAEAADREAAGGEPSGERIVDPDRAIPSAAVAPLDVEALVQRLDAADQALKRHTLGMSLAVPEIGSPWWEREEAIRALCAYADAIRKRGGA